MSEHPDPADVPIHNAATVMLIRDPDPAQDRGVAGAGSTGVEVFMLRRTANAVFASHVFPERSLGSQVAFAPRKLRV